ncbi:MAG: hypothetical protein FWC09_04385 [Lachnospiraceae bacterium]|nr:hypothetical protein [Lachnospiraceae bacterium]
MFGNILNDSDFVNELKNDLARIEKIAQEENRTIDEILEMEHLEILEEIDTILSENIKNVKKRQLSKICEDETDFDELCDIAEKFAENLGFVA